MITKKEIYLEALSNSIRKYILRLRELGKGCLLSDKGNNLYLIHTKERNDCYYIEDLENGNIEHFKTDYIKKYFKIVGHEITLNDVLEYFEIRRQYIYIGCDGHFYKKFYEEEFIDVSIVIDYPWDLSKPYLKDQSEELINSLYKFAK